MPIFTRNPRETAEAILHQRLTERENKRKAYIFGGPVSLNATREPILVASVPGTLCARGGLGHSRNGALDVPATGGNPSSRPPLICVASQPP